jgi:hypothetical protein
LAMVRQPFCEIQCQFLIMDAFTCLPLEIFGRNSERYSSPDLLSETLMLSQVSPTNNYCSLDHGGFF